MVQISWKAFRVWLTTLVHVVVFSLSSGTSPGELCVLIYPDRTSLAESVLCLVIIIKVPGLTWWDRSHVRGEVRELPVLVYRSFEVRE